MQKVHLREGRRKRVLEQKMGATQSRHTIMFHQALTAVLAGENLSMQEMAGAINVVMLGNCDEADLASFLTALRVKGETVDEVAGAASAMRRHMSTIKTQQLDLLDTCGTGGDGSQTFNISTAAAIVAAASGVAVAKHGNRAMTSKTGSADVLSELGVNVAANLETVQRCLDELGICFCSAQLAHPAMKHVASIRKKLSVPTIFNLLGPLCNPANAKYQLLGVAKPHLRHLLAAALAKLNVERAVVVCGEDGLDEVTLTGTTQATEVCGETLSEFSWQPIDFGLATASVKSMLVDGPAESAAMIRDILQGNAGPSRDIVILNAAAALWTVGNGKSPLQCANRAAEAIDSGQAAKLLSQLSALSNS